MKTNQAKKFFFLAVLALTFAFVQQAHAQSSISGRLIDKSSNPISNGFVVLYNQAGAECGGTNTLADGTYTIGGLSAGAYRVFFLGTPAYVALWYNNKTDLDSADPITLTANQVLTGINAQLPDYSALFGSISGRVTNAGGSPLFNVKLQLYNPATGQWGNKISTASDGTYSFTWLWPGSYKVAFWGIQGQYLQQWYNNKADMVSADPITVTANNATSGIDAQLAAYNSALLGSISGTMTDPCANPLPEVEVTLYDQTNLLWGDVIYTDAEGTYSFTDLWPGSYKVFFGGTVGEEQWYDNKPDIDSADPIQVTANNAATGINALLGPCGTTTTVVTTILPTTTTIAISTTTTAPASSSSSSTTTAAPVSSSSSSTTTAAPVSSSSSSTTTTTIKVAADFNGNGNSDILWRNDSTGQVYMMLMNGLSITVGAHIWPASDTAWKIMALADFNGDGKADILWRNDSTGQIYMMLMNGFTITAQNFLIPVADLTWKIVGAADFDGDGKADILWRNDSTGQVYIMLMNGFACPMQGPVYQEPNTAWKIVATGDYNGDGKADILWRNDSTGQAFMLLMDGLAVSAGAHIWPASDTAWKIVASADFNGDAKSDILWRNDSTGQIYMMLMNGFTIFAQNYVIQVADLSWKIVAAADYNGDGKADILWRHDTNGQVYIMLMNGMAIPSQGLIYQEPSAAWKIIK